MRPWPARSVLQRVVRKEEGNELRPTLEGRAAGGAVGCCRKGAVACCREGTLAVSKPVHHTGLQLSTVLEQRTGRLRLRRPMQDLVRGLAALLLWMLSFTAIMAHGT